MKAELTLPSELVDLIADTVIDKLRPLLSGNGRSREEDVILDVSGLADYLKASKKWVYERVQFNEIPYLKLNGLLRFRKNDIERWLNRHNCPVINTSESILKTVRHGR